MVDSVLKRMLALTPTQFENLVYECLSARGMKNLIWRTPGADGGRDIEGATFDMDISGATDARRWYVECKRYSSSIDWPTVRGKIAYAESNNADFLLVATTANPSPQCENEIAKWNEAKRRPQVRFWRGYDLPNIVRGVPHIATMFGLSADNQKAIASLNPLAELATRLAQNSYARVYFNNNDTSSVETVAAISELFSVRLNDLRSFGRPALGPRVRGVRLFEWLKVEANISDWEDTALRATLAFIKYEYQAEKGVLSLVGRNLQFAVINPRSECSAGLVGDRDTITFWSRISAKQATDPSIWVLEKLAYV